MARKVAAQDGPSLVVVNQGAAPTIYTNHCEVGVIADEFRIIFREVLAVDEDKLVTREVTRVYFNETVARQLHRMFGEALGALERGQAAR